ncbi:MAG: helix-turn-helix domain-containing protein [Emergencia sp.]
MDYEKTGKLIQEARKAKGLTQVQLADMLGITDRAVSKWERGKSFPDVGLLSSLGHALDLSAGELLEGEKKEGVQLTRAESDQTAVKGIRLYLNRQRNKGIAAATFVLIVILLTGGFCVWLHRSIDFQRETVYFPSVFVDEKNGDEYELSMDGEYNEIIMNELRNLLAEEVVHTEPAEIHADENTPEIILEGAAVFYPEGYKDLRSGKEYTFPACEAVFREMKSILQDFRSLYQGHYDYRGKTRFTYQDRILSVSCPVDDPAYELIIDYYRRELEKPADLDHPDAYVLSRDIRSMHWMKPEEYADEEMLTEIWKEIEYRELYDWRVYQVQISQLYSDEMKSLGPQIPEGDGQVFFLLGKHSDETEFRICYIKNGSIS